MMSAENPIRDALIGVIIGDALGVPVEFKSRKTIAEDPVTDMIGYGTYNQPPGTWSDDSSMMLCTAEVLAKEFDLEAIAKNFVKWAYETHWTPHGYVFDIGVSTRHALARVKRGETVYSSGNIEESSNGNGSLMRIMPILFHVDGIEDRLGRYQIIADVSNITHAHVRSQLACYYYIEFARHLLTGCDFKTAHENTNTEFWQICEELEIASTERQNFTRLTKPDFGDTDISDIHSSGYVIHTLEASIWCLLTTSTYSEAVLKAVNLDEDTDTTGAVTGGLAGLFYGASTIPQHWTNMVARLKDIEDLIEAFNTRLAA